MLTIRTNELNSPSKRKAMDALVSPGKKGRTGDGSAAGSSVGTPSQAPSHSSGNTDTFIPRYSKWLVSQGTPLEKATELAQRALMKTKIQKTKRDLQERYGIPPSEGTGYSASSVSTGSWHPLDVESLASGEQTPSVHSSDKNSQVGSVDGYNDQLKGNLNSRHAAVSRSLVDLEQDAIYKKGEYRRANLKYKKAARRQNKLNYRLSNSREEAVGTVAEAKKARLEQWLEDNGIDAKSFIASSSTSKARSTPLRAAESPSVQVQSAPLQVAESSSAQVQVPQHQDDGLKGRRKSFVDLLHSQIFPEAGARKVGVEHASTLNRAMIDLNSRKDSSGNLKTQITDAEADPIFKAEAKAYKKRPRKPRARRLPEAGSQLQDKLGKLERQVEELLAQQGN